METKEKHVHEWQQTLNWWLVPVHGYGKLAKKPLFGGWPDFHPNVEHLAATFEFRGDAGLGVNLGASALIDLEADTPEGEKVLADLCQGIECPCYQSRRSVHRLYQAHDEVTYLKVAGLVIEFRAGRHQSVVPPSVIDGTEYRWRVNPFDCPPPPISERILGYYLEQREKPANDRGQGPRSARTQPWPYRDRFDFILQHLDLMREAKQAGLVFALDCPDKNGNIPCYVPTVLRSDGNEDDTPSGVFNVFNGVLRDFATGRNHLFFNTLAALTGEPWRGLLKKYEAKAKPKSGWPHSRRISYPSDDLSPPDRVTLETARADLSAYLETQLSRPPIPKTIHLIEGQPGVGKTYTLCQKLGQKGKKAIVLTLENKLAQTHDKIINEHGGRARRMPVLRETACPTPDDYERVSRRGFAPSKSFPCRKCPVGPRNCPYLLAFSSVNDADQLCAAAVYHTHEDFYGRYGNEHRHIVVFDENSVDQFLEPQSWSLAAWQAWGQMLRRYQADHPKDKHLRPIFALIDWLGETAGAFLADANKPKYAPYLIPDHLHVPKLKKKQALEKWLNKAACRKEHRHVQNLYRAAVYLLSQPDTYVLLQRIEKPDGDVILVRFLKKNPLPADKEVFILDATANRELLKAIAPDWDLRVWNCPPIEQKGTVIQIMDYDVSRARIKREVERHQEHNPSWLVQTIDQILETHGPAALVTFKSVINGTAEVDILSKLKHRDLITDKYNFPCRGHNIEAQRLIVVGTPYKDQAAIWELALAVNGLNGLPQSSYEHRLKENGYFVAENMGYEEAHLATITDFLVCAELAQAIGRVRPLQNKRTVFVISNAQIPGWDVQQFTANELFDVRNTLRRDASSNYQMLSTIVHKLLEGGDWVKVTQVRDAINQLQDRTIAKHWKRFKADNKDRLDIEHGRIRLRHER